MFRRVLAVAVLAALAYAAFAWSRHRTATAQLNSGDYTCQGCLAGDAKARALQENSADSADGNSNPQSAPARAAAEQSNPQSRTSMAERSGKPSMMEPGAQASDGIAAAPASVSPAYASSMGAPPGGDSIVANPQNGLPFRGAGSYQWYRQGNITWRLDTTTGKSCIVYATMEEWRKQVVMSHGCGRNS